jgi:hypothetical protein
MAVGESALHGLANVGESGESSHAGLANVGETGESQYKHETRHRHVHEYSRHSQNLHSQNSLSSGYCLDGTHVWFIFAVVWMPRKGKKSSNPENISET